MNVKVFQVNDQTVLENNYYEPFTKLKILNTRTSERFDPDIVNHVKITAKFGYSFIPEPIHAGGLRYHGMAPLVSHIYELGLLEAISIPQTECFEGALQFARTEGIVPAPEPTHAFAAAVREAMACRESGEEKVILTALCGHGHLDLAAYETFLSGQMVDLDLPDRAIQEAMQSVPKIEG